MREINSDIIVKEVKKLFIEANYYLNEEMIEAFKEAKKKEESPTGKDILDQLLENAEIARGGQFPLCQDTGFAVVFVELGSEVIIKGATLPDAINEGVRQAYKDGYLRKSILGDPVIRKNTGDNTPAIIHIEIVPGDKLKIEALPKGGGSENMSMVKMLKPADGAEGIKEFVLQRVKEAGPNPCPPIVVGVGIGGTFEKAALIAKKALLRPFGSHNPEPHLAEMEKELFKKINNLGIGPQGLGGRTTALAVHVEAHPCHIASLPVAINIECHAHRHKEVVI
jgi:fumarate hydratase subunit alpha